MRNPEVTLGPAEPESTGQVHAIVPAHGGSNADLVARQLSRELAEGYRLSVLLADFCARGFPLWGTSEAPQRLDGRTWGAFLRSHAVFDTLEAREAHPTNIRRLLDHARRLYHITCAELSDAKESSALEVLRYSDSILLVTNSDPASVELARYRAAWLRSMELQDRSALLVNNVTGGAREAEVEQQTGLPVFAAVDDPSQLCRLAERLATPQLAYCAKPMRLVS